MDVISQIVKRFGLTPGSYTVQAIGSGYIHQTYRLTGEKSFVLQRVNKNVFPEPEVIASNLGAAADYLRTKHPDFLFLTPIPTTSGEGMTYAGDGFPWRLFPYFDNTFTIDKVESEAMAFSAAAAFGRLTRTLSGADLQLFHPTIERFHDLSWRWEQFQDALCHGRKDRLTTAAAEIHAAEGFRHLVDEYNNLTGSGLLVPRITHNDTKINNVLFDATTGEATCAIDLDTLMPGYFIYDVGDMIRTFVSPVDEEERDLSKVIVRPNIYRALIDGYMSEMENVLTEAEKGAVAFSGKMMTFIMALRMLTDFLNGDVYYQIRYDDQNLVRAKNQFKLLAELSK